MQPSTSKIAGFPLLVGIWLIATFIAIVVAMFMLSGAESRPAIRMHQCSNNLKRIGLALQIYKDEHGTFPPAYIADAHGRPMHSWRVLILPYFEGIPEAEVVAKQYDFSEPWDGPQNRRLIERMPRVFACPDDKDAPPGATSYAAIVGDESAWPFDRGRRANEFADGLSNTFLVVETTGRAISWTEPRDLDFDQLDFTINGPSGYGMGIKHHGGAHALTADGAVRFFPDTTSRDVVRAATTAAGGEPIPPP